MGQGHSAEEINKHVKRYLMVFGALLVLTLITVAVSFVHLPIGKAVVVAMAVALTKGSLVAAIFMHLMDDFRKDRPVLYWSLIATVFMFFCVLLLPILTHLDRTGLH